MSYYRRVLRTLLWTSVLTILLSGCYRGTRPQGIGRPAPDFTVRDGDRTVVFSQLRGHVIVLNFWATWCAPCVEEMPSLVALQQRLRKQDVAVLAVSIDDDDASYHHFLQANKIDLLTVRDEAKRSSNLYGTFKFPETYIIDRQGIVRRKFIGAVDWSQPEIIDFLSKL